MKCTSLRPGWVPVEWRPRIEVRGDTIADCGPRSKSGVTTLRICILTLLLAGASNAAVATFDDLTLPPQSYWDGPDASDGSPSGAAIEYWAGSGSNEAVVVIDFGVDSYAFGYRWDGGTKYGKDLLDAVDAAGSLDHTEVGGFLTTLSYGTHVNTGQSGWPSGWWSYFVSADGKNWVSSDVGFAARELSNGAWDGWAYQTTSAWPPAHLPVTPIPQPRVAAGPDYDSNDFAVEVVEYVQGEGVGRDWLTRQPFNDPNAALGPPALKTTGDGWYVPTDESVPVVPVYSPFRASELVTIGNGGQLTVKFNHPVADDENNPYGIDFIIYGDAYQLIGKGQGWTNGNPEEIILAGSASAEPGIVAVSQDGQNWYYFSSGPYADSFAPTAGRRWDDVNDLWAEELDPTKPVNPNLAASDMEGMTLAEMIRAYDGSAGGTGFDLRRLAPEDYAALAVDPNNGNRWVQYIRVQDDPYSNVTTEIDAIADVRCCGDYKHPYPVGDLSGNCTVDYEDLAMLSRYWLAETSGPNDPAGIADLYEDQVVHFYDWALIADHWRECTWQCK